MQTETRYKPRPENFAPAKGFKLARHPFTPTPQGSYRFPRSVHERLTSVLEPYKNRDEAYALALLLARCWSNADRIDLAFPVVRRTGEAKGQGTWGGLCDVAELGLSAGRVRGARTLLERIEFLTRTIPPTRSKHRATDDGLRRKPVMFTFGSDYRSAFKAANARAAAAREARSGERRVIAPISSLMASTARFSNPNLPKYKSPPERTVFMGKLDKKCGLPPLAFDPDSPLDAALARLSQGVFGKAEALPALERGPDGS